MSTELVTGLLAAAGWCLVGFGLGLVVILVGLFVAKRRDESKLRGDGLERLKRR